MDYIISLLQNLISNPIYENSELLKSSIETRITSINSQIKDTQAQIEKQNDLLNLYKSNLETAEKKYEESKDKLKQYNKTVNKKITTYKNKLNNLLNNSTEDNKKLESICTEIDNVYTKFKFDKNITILERYSKINKEIEDNVIECEIIKEKIKPINIKLTDLNNKISEYNEQSTKLNDVKTTL